MLMLAHSGQRQAAIAQYHTCRRVLREELGVEPMPETTALFKRMRAAISPPRHNLPTPSSVMLGRHEEMRLLFGLLTDPDCQLITLTGMGGSGKTRLSLEIARAFASPTTTPAEQPFADGIVFVQLAEVTLAGPEQANHAVLTTCATALDLPLEGSVAELRERVALHLKSREMLLVLDNFEHLRAGAEEVHLLLRQAPYVKVLATSRAPLHLEGERVLHVDGLGLPTTPAEVECAEASALFLQEARRVQVGFMLPEAQRPYLVKMCRQLGGFPLALILAARWAPVLPCSEIVRELADGVDVLATPESDLPERHRSVRLILDSALAQLSTEERALAQTLADQPPDGERARPPGQPHHERDAAATASAQRAGADLDRRDVWDGAAAPATVALCARGEARAAWADSRRLSAFSGERRGPSGEREISRSRRNGCGITPTGTSTSTGSAFGDPSASRSRPSSSPGVVARAPRTPKLSASSTKSGIQQFAAENAPTELFCLGAAHVAIRLIVEDDGHQPDAELARRRQLGQPPAEAPVAADREHRLCLDWRRVRRAPSESHSQACPGSPARCSSAGDTRETLPGTDTRPG